MSDKKKTEQLLADFYNGDTTPEEEEILMNFFNNEDLDKKWHTDRDLFHALYDPSRIPLPKGFSERLESVIDNHIAETADRKSSPKMRKLFISLLSAAAVALLCIGLFFTFGKTSKLDFMADTYKNPEEAAIVAEQTLLFISAKLNQGLHPLEVVKENIHKTNELINEHLKIN